MTDLERLADLVRQAQALADQIGVDVSRETSAFEVGYRTGYLSGYERGQEIGRTEALAEEDAKWRQVCEGTRGWANIPPYSEQEMIRWGGPRERYGDPRPGDYLGKGEQC